MPATENKYPPFQVRESQKEEISTYIKKAHEIEDMYNIPRNMLAGLLYAESNFNPKAVSKVGAQGIAQFMPATAKEVKLKDPFNPIESIEKAGEYLKKQYDKFETWDKALAAYNWGRGNVLNKGLDKAPTETRNYIEKVPYYQQELNKYLGIEETSTEIPTNSNSIQELTLEGLNNEGNIDISEFPFSAQVKDNTNYTIPKFIPQKQIERKDPQFQPQKREGELTTAQFLEQYLQGNEFQDGGLLNLYPDGGKLPPERKPIYVSDKNDPRYKAYKDSLDLYNKSIDIKEKLSKSPIVNNSEVSYNINQADYPNIKEILPESITQKRFLNEEEFDKILKENPLKFFNKSGIGKDNNLIYYYGEIPNYKKPEQEVVIRPKKQAPQSMLDSLNEIFSKDNKQKSKSTISKKEEIKEQIKEEIKPDYSKQLNISSHFQYGYYDNSGKFVRKDYKHNEQGKREFEEAKNKSGFRIINSDNLTKNSGYKPSEDRFNYNPNEFAIGGYTDNEMKNTENILTEFNEGGSHESNPLGGIPQGTDSQGVPNLVEQGEVKADIDGSPYIFPVRNGERVTKELLSKYNINSKYAGKSPADIAKKFISEDASHFTDKETAKEQLKRLSSLNEEIKTQIEMEENMNNNQFFLGGGMEANNIGSGAMSGAFSGASTGMSFGPIGALIGGGVGAIAGGLLGQKANKERQRQATNNSFASNLEFRQFKNGGNFYPNGGTPSDNPNWLADLFSSKGLHSEDNLQITTPTNNNDNNGGRFSFLQRLNEIPSIHHGTQVTPPSISTPGVSPNTSLTSKSLYNDDIVRGEEEGGTGNKETDLSTLGLDALRFGAPLLSNLIQSNRLEKPTYQRSPKIDTRFQPQYVDESSLMNTIRESTGNTRRALTESSAGNAGALSANLLASQLAETRGMSDAMLSAEDINRQQNLMGQQFNLGIDQANIQTELADKERFAQQKGMHTTQRNALTRNTFENISNASLEMLRRKYPEMAGLDYDWRGRYLKLKDKNNKIIASLSKEEQEELEKVQI